MNEASWLTEQMVLAIHEDLISLYGGLSGVKDPALLAVSLARPQHKFSYQSEVSLWELAAAYGFALPLLKNSIDWCNSPQSPQS